MGAFLVKKKKQGHFGSGGILTCIPGDIDTTQRSSLRPIYVDLLIFLKKEKNHS
jgi:hypothetical protein